MKALTLAHRANHNRQDGENRRRTPDSRVGRRQSDAWFPYSTPFVAQALAQAEQPLPRTVKPLQGYAEGRGCADVESAKGRRAVTA